MTHAHIPKLCSFVAAPKTMQATNVATVFGSCSELSQSSGDLGEDE